MKRYSKLAAGVLLALFALLLALPAPARASEAELVLPDLGRVRPSSA